MREPRNVHLLPVLLVSIIFGLTHESRASFYSGNEMKSLCISTTPYDRGLCLGFVAGVNDMTRASGGRYYCLPKEVTLGQLVAVVTKRLRDEPERLHQSAAVIVIRALHYAFPCK